MFKCVTCKSKNLSIDNNNKKCYKCSYPSQYEESKRLVLRINKEREYMNNNKRIKIDDNPNNPDNITNFFIWHNKIEKERKKRGWGGELYNLD